MKLLEVIVTSVNEAREAEQGGANRLELVRDFDLEGLTPDLSLVEDVVAAVSIPVRVMLRESASFTVQDDSEFQRLKTDALRISELPVSGLVLGFLCGDMIDEHCIQQLLETAPFKPVTFHRAFDAMPDPISAINTVKSFEQVDRVLTSGGDGSWSQRRSALEHLQQMAGPRVMVLAGGGLNEETLPSLMESPLLKEFHVGRGARDSSGELRSSRIAALRRLLDS
jgi:copper homeostasis protein